MIRLDTFHITHTWGDITKQRTYHNPQFFGGDITSSMIPWTPRPGRHNTSGDAPLTPHHRGDIITKLGTMYYAYNHLLYGIHIFKPTCQGISSIDQHNARQTTSQSLRVVSSPTISGNRKSISSTPRRYFFQHLPALTVPHTKHVKPKYDRATNIRIVFHQIIAFFL